MSKVKEYHSKDENRTHYSKGSVDEAVPGLHSNALDAAMFIGHNGLATAVRELRITIGDDVNACHI